MSHSNFKLIANDEPVNRNLVIIVNKNGEVGTDTLALQNLLTSRETPETGITIIRETSPTPSISDEIEEDDMQQNELLRQQLIAENPNLSEEEIEQQLNKLTAANSVPHVSLNVENFFAPDQAKKFASDVLNLGGIENPQTLMPIDQNFRRQIVQNDHCYTPLTMSSSKEAKEKPNKSTKAKDQQTKSVNKKEPKAKVRQVVKEEVESSDSADDDEDVDEEQSAEEEDISFSESDDDNDMDFSVNDRFGKKGKKKRKYRRRDKQKSMTFKDFLEGGGEMSSMDEEPKKKYGKVSKKPQQSPRVSGKNIGPSTVSKNAQQTPPTRKVPVQANKNAALRKEVTATLPVTSTVKPAQNVTNPSAVISHISIQSAAPAKSTQEIEFVESMVKDLEKTFPENDKKTATQQQQQPTTSIPNIMQMMETNTPTEVIDQSLSTLENIDANVVEEIGDAIIAALGNEAIDELLNHEDLMNFDSAQTQATHVKPANSLVTSSTAPLLQSTQVSDMSLMQTTTSSSLVPKILNKQAPVKDPIKVVRNGRVITLPPIEAPTTRGAKRRAQGDPITTSPPATKTVKSENKTPSTKDPDSRNSSRRSSLNKSESGRNSRRQSTAQGGTIDEENEEGSDVSWNSEDDPDRLWCICRMPHNNRFMICCDKCEDWFHGTCVNVTKAMGKDIEKQNIKWLCPNCKSGAVKKDPNKKPLNQQKLTKFFSKHMKESTDEDVPKTNNTSIMCAVCHKKPARTDSIYCSEDCIRNHATKHLDDNSTQPKTPTTPTVSAKSTDVKRGNVLKDQSGNVSVYDRTTGKLLSAKLWPHISNLGQWLSQNPNYEPVKPGSSQANQLLSRSSKNSQVQQQQQQQQQQQNSPHSTVTSTSSPHHTTKHGHQPTVIQGDELFSNPVKIHTGAKDNPPNLVQKKLTNLQNPVKSNSPKSSPTTSRPPLLKSSSVSSSTSSNKSVPSPKTYEGAKKVKRQVSDEKAPPTSTPSNSKSKIEYERMNVRSNLKTTLMQRMKDIDDPSIPKMNEEEVEKFAKSIEHEMFMFYNKDTRDKYKVKFRSLKFNLSDVKNKTLIERICLKKFSPKQLVELPASELASKELSKWREEENKHQLEIITKSELDALAQNKIVLKTHKGEEIIETKAADISLPDDDVESIIEKTVLSVEDPHGRYDLSRSISLNVSGNHSVSSPLSSPSISSSTGRKSDSHHHDHSRSRSKSRGREHHHSSSHHKSSSKHKKSEHRHRSRSPKHHHSSHHSHSRDKSRDKSHERDKKKSDTHSEKHHRDKSRSNEKDKSNSRSKESRDSAKDSKKHHHTHHSTSSSSKESTKKEETAKIEIKPEQKDVDIVGKILDSMGVHLDTKLKTEDEKTPKSEENAVTKTPDLLVTSSDAALVPVSVEPVNEHQLEIEIYSGNMYMADVANFDVTASVVSGNIDDIIKLFNPQMEIVGRIEPKTVWDYLGKVKKLPGKELTVIRFSSTDESAYFSLFSYLHSRQRYGVIKPSAPNIKDFYLITVEANRPLPNVLLPINGPGFIEGEEHKPDLLLGVILKLTPESKHAHKKATVKKAAKNPKPVEHIVPIQILPPKHKSHHSHSSHSAHGSSNNNSKLTMGLPEVKSDDMKLSPKKSPDDDEPYTPFDEEESLTPPARNYGQHSASRQSTSREKMNTSDDLESEMEKLNREIERRQMEIQTLAQQKALELNEEQATKIYEKISVPHNLSEILSTIKASEPKPMEIDDDEEYVPINKGIPAPATHEYRASSSYAAVIQQPVAPIANSMMDIDERINLFRQEMPAEQPSRLASMSDADLLALVPEDAIMAPPPPIISSNSISEPAIPGLEYEAEQ